MQITVQIRTPCSHLTSPAARRRPEMNSKFCAAYQPLMTDQTTRLRSQSFPRKRSGILPRTSPSLRFFIKRIGPSNNMVVILIFKYFLLEAGRVLLLCLVLDAQNGSMTAKNMPVPIERHLGNRTTCGRTRSGPRGFRILMSARISWRKKSFFLSGEYSIRQMNALQISGFAL